MESLVETRRFWAKNGGCASATTRRGQMTAAHDDARLIAARQAYAELGTHIEAILFSMAAENAEPQEPPRLALVYVNGVAVSMDSEAVGRWPVE